jgi:hypothetical protein
MAEFDEVYCTKKTIRDALASFDITYKNLCLEIIRDNIERTPQPLYSDTVYNIKQNIRDALASDDVEFKNLSLYIIRNLYSILYPQPFPPPSEETSLVSDEEPVSS